MKLLTVSRLRARRKCKRLESILYVEGFRTIHEDENLAFGSLWHEAMDGWWGALAQGKSDVAWGCAMDAIAGKARDPFAQVRAEELLAGYDARWRAETVAAFDVTAVEVEFRAGLLNPSTLRTSKTWMLGGKVDKCIVSRAGGRGIVEHKCLAGDMRIRDYATGEYLPVRQLIGRDVRVLCLSRDGTLGISDAKVRTAEIRDIYEVVTRAGRRLRVSDNHPVLTSRGWMPAAALRAKDWIAIPRKTGGASLPAHDLAEMRFIGYMLGDGTLTSMTFTKTDENVLNDFERVAASIGETVSVRRPEGGRAPYVKCSVAEDAPGLAVLRKHGIGRCLAAEKAIPDALLSIDDDSARHLVGALWSTDGCVDVYREERRGKMHLKPRIAFVSRSKNLACGVRDLLLLIGIQATTTESSVLYRGERREVFTTKVVTRDGKRRFLVDVIEGRIPFLRSGGKVRQALSAIVEGDDARERPPSAAFAADNVLWDRVATVVVSGREPTFDVSVPGPENFVVEDIITHNTSSEDVSPGSPYWVKLEMDHQVSNYYVGAETFGFRPEFCLYDVVLKPGQKPLKATPPDKRKYKADGTLYANQREQDETPEEYRVRVREAIEAEPSRYFIRAEIPRTDAQLRDFLDDAWAEAKAMHEDHLARRAPRNPEACHAYGQCPFWEACSTGTDPAEMPERYQRLAWPHPELTPDTHNGGESENGQ